MTNDQFAPASILATMTQAQNSMILYLCFLSFCTSFVFKCHLHCPEFDGTNILMRFPVICTPYRYFSVISVRSSTFRRYICIVLSSKVIHLCITRRFHEIKYFKKVKRAYSYKYYQSYTLFVLCGTYRIN